MTAHAVLSSAIAYARARRCSVLSLRAVLSAYARATRCPVLSQPATTRALRYGPTRCAVLTHVTCAIVLCDDRAYGTEAAYGAMRCPVLRSRMVLRQVLLTSHSSKSVQVSAYAPATRCPVLTLQCPILAWRMMLSAYARAMRCPVLRSCMLLPAGCY
eukprot:1915175-Rhodomonas_salina.1